MHSCVIIDIIIDIIVVIIVINLLLSDAAAAYILGKMEHSKISQGLWQMCAIQVEPLSKVRTFTSLRLTCSVTFVGEN